ncbi:MAG: hypothetical protein JKX85_09640 [Phycisphaeraceae bacterium]|nr:hypothetical protein [Phycisphaeraceae bacterium]
MDLIRRLSCVLLLLLTGNIIAQQQAVPDAMPSDMQATDAMRIVVQPHVIYNANGYGNLARIRSYFSCASWEWPISDRSWELLKPLGIDSFRLINIEGNNLVADSNKQGSYIFQPHPRLKQGLDDCAKFYVRPHLILGHVIQQALANKTDDGTLWGVSDWDAYEKYAYDCLAWINENYDFPLIELEVGNEPDINGMKWMLPDKLALGSLKMYEQYMQIYRAWAGAVTKFTAEKKQKQMQIQIGGPDVTLYTFVFADSHWVKRFLQDTSAENLRVDFVSFHFYGNGGGIGPHTSFGPWQKFDQYVTDIRRSMRQAQMQRPLRITEWGPTWHTRKLPDGLLNSSHIGAAWDAAFLHDLLANDIDDATALIFRNHGTYPDKPYEDNWQWSGYLTRDGNYPKATYNVFAMFSMLPGQRIEATTQRQNVGVIASADEHSVGVLAWNMSFDFEHQVDQSRQQPVQLQVGKLPFDAKFVSVKRYLVDETHSNLYHFVETGKVTTGKDVTDVIAKQTTLQLIEELSIPVVDQHITLPVTQLSPSSVSLWLIRPSH